MLFQQLAWGLGATAAAFVGSPTKVLRAIDFNTTVHGDLPATWKSVYAAALKSAPNSANGITVGAAPFARVINLLDKREYVPTYSEQARLFKLQASPSSPWPWSSINLPVVYFIDDSDESLAAYFDKYGGQVAAAVSAACGVGGNVLGILHLDAAGSTATRVTAAACARYKAAPMTTVNTPSTVVSTGRQMPAPPSRGGGAADLFVQTPGGAADPNTRTSVDLTPSAESKYKPGSIARFNTTRSVWVVYSPLAGLGGLGAADVTPPVPTGFVKVAEEAATQGMFTAPAGTKHAGVEEDSVAFFKRPIVWVVGGALVVVGGTAIYLLTRKKAA